MVAITKILVAIIAVYMLSWIVGAGICFLLNKYRRRKQVSTETGISTTKSPRNCIFHIKNHFGNCAEGMEKWMIQRVGKIPSHWVRMLFYKYVFQMSIGDKVVIYAKCRFRYPCKISIGDGSIIGDDSWIDGRGGLQIGDDCNLSSEVRIWTAQHNVQSPDFSYEQKPVVIDNRAWISSNTVILPGIHVGEGAVIASGAVVTKNVEAYGIYAGVPAQRIGTRNSDIQYHFYGEHGWFL